LAAESAALYALAAAEAKDDVEDFDSMRRCKSWRKKLSTGRKNTRGAHGNLQLFDDGLERRPLMRICPAAVNQSR
jgi:hypothetical protein